MSAPADDTDESGLWVSRRTRGRISRRIAGVTGYVFEDPGQVGLSATAVRLLSAGGARLRFWSARFRNRFAGSRHRLRGRRVGLRGCRKRRDGRDRLGDLGRGRVCIVLRRGGRAGRSNVDPHRKRYRADEGDDTGR